MADIVIRATAIADIAIGDTRISAIGPDVGGGKLIVDGRGLTFAPGFVDVHAHNDVAVAIDPDMAFRVLGGAAGWAGLSARVATRLPGTVDSDGLKREVADILARHQQADGFEILKELELRLGRGPSSPRPGSRRPCLRSSHPDTSPPA